jgi:hypothetical protein
MRWLRILALVIGWLLTPLVVWAASLLGAWIGASAAYVMPTADSALVTTIGGGAAAGLVAALLWMRLLRRSPRLRRSLAITREGIPLTGELLHAIQEAEAPVQPHQAEAPAPEKQEGAE